MSPSADSIETEIAKVKREAFDQIDFHCCFSCDCGHQWETSINLHAAALAAHNDHTSLRCEYSLHEKCHKCQSKRLRLQMWNGEDFEQIHFLCCFSCDCGHQWETNIQLHAATSAAHNDPNRPSENSHFMKCPTRLNQSVTEIANAKRRRVRPNLMLLLWLRLWPPMR